jgi:8-oxo-dGTP pyrophosphatase MutT (NUDIX family)
VRALYWLAYRLDLLRSVLLRPRSQGAYVAVWFNGELLLIRNSYKGVLTLPCGKIEAGEAPDAAAARELREEVGLCVEAGDLRASFQTLSTSEYKRDQVHVFDLQLGAAPSLRLDGCEVIWAGFRSCQEALALPLHAPVRAYVLNHPSGDPR